jgi:catechol 2,3-dioxygenase-like lactoylglutathione lyase family enzyme
VPIIRASVSPVVLILIAPGVVTSVGIMLGVDPKAYGVGALTTARPYLVSLSIANLDASVRWYRDMLAFREARRLNVPDSSSRISFLELNGFRLELTEFKDLVSSAAIRSKFPAVDDQAKVQGFGKLAFAVTNVGVVAASLKSKKVKFVRNVTQEKDTGERWFMIEDVDENCLQFFEVRT